MRNGVFTAEEKLILLANKYVVDVVQDSQIIYANEFKKLFIEQYMAGEKPSKIFSKAGFDTKLIGSKRIERACYRWRAAYNNGVLDVFDAGSVRHEAHAKRREGRIEKLKKEHRTKTAALEERLESALSQVRYLKSKLARLEQKDRISTRLRLQFYIKEGIDLSEEISYIGRRIGELRRQQGITMLKLATVLGFSHSTLREIERGNRSVTLETLLKLVVLFDCPIDSFFRQDSIETDN